MELKDYTNDIFEVIDETASAKYIYAWDLDEDLVRWTQLAVDYFGLEDIYLRNVKECWENLIHPNDLENFWTEMNAVLNKEKDTFFLNFKIKNGEGTYVNCTSKGRKMTDKNAFVGTITVMNSIINYDVVTNLSTFYELISSVNTAISKKEKFIIMAIEICHFHTINSVYGVDFGNKLLFELGSCFKSIFRGIGKPFRLEGTKFAFFIKGHDVSVIQQKFTSIKNLVHHFPLDGQVISLDINGGAVISGNVESDCQAYISYLMSVLETSKEERNNEMVIFNEEATTDNMENLELLEVVKQSIFNDCEGFYLVYQPLVSTINGTVIGAEALIRWRSEEYGNVAPYRFIPYLESHPSFYELGLWILKRALIDAKVVMKNLPSFFINVNISYTQLEHHGFKKDVMDILEEVDFPKQNLQLELTERCRNLNVEFLKDVLGFFKEQGIKIALDDFGTGTSGLGLVCELPLDSLKIDQGFMRNILSNKTSQVIVDTAVECASRLGINTCLEGIENEDIRDFAHVYSANYHQGYFYSKPVEFDDFLHLIGYSWSGSKPRLIRSTGHEEMNVQNILSRMPGGFFIYSASDGERIVEINEAAINMYGCSTIDEFVDLTKNSFKGMVHPEDYDRVQKEISEQIERTQNEMDYVEYRIIRKDGEIRYVRDYGHLVHTAYNDDLYYVFIIEDYRK